jgi:hypothetical protein
MQQRTQEYPRVFLLLRWGLVGCGIPEGRQSADADLWRRDGALQFFRIAREAIVADATSLSGACFRTSLCSVGLSEEAHDYQIRIILICPI